VVRAAAGLHPHETGHSGQPLQVERLVQGLADVVGDSVGLGMAPDRDERIVGRVL